MPEESPAGDSKSNGFIGRAIQTVQGQVRVVKAALEGRLNDRILADHQVLPWLVMHAANQIKRHQVCKQGRTAYRSINRE